MGNGSLGRHFPSHEDMLQQFGGRNINFISFLSNSMDNTIISDENCFQTDEFQFPKIDIFVPYNFTYDLTKHIHGDLSSQRKYFNRKTNILQRGGVGAGEWWWGGGRHAKSVRIGTSVLST